MADPDFESFPLRVRGNRFEEFVEGQELEHHWGRTLSAADNTLFATLTLAYCPLYTNAEYARAHDHPDTPIHPLLVLATALGLSVEDLSEAGGAFLGMDDVEFHRPVYPGDTLTARSRVLSARRSRSRPDQGIVSWHTEAYNQRSELVLEYRRSNLILASRPSEARSGAGE